MQLFLNAAKAFRDQHFWLLLTRKGPEPASAPSSCWCQSNSEPPLRFRASHLFRPELSHVWMSAAAHPFHEHLRWSDSEKSNHISDAAAQVPNGRCARRSFYLVHSKRNHSRAIFGSSQSGVAASQKSEIRNFCGALQTARLAAPPPTNTCFQFPEEPFLTQYTTNARTV